MQGQGKQKVKVYYIGVLNFVWLPESQCTEQNCWLTFACSVFDLPHLADIKIMNKHPVF